MPTKSAGTIPEKEIYLTDSKIIILLLTVQFMKSSFNKPNKVSAEKVAHENI